MRALRAQVHFPSVTLHANPGVSNIGLLGIELHQLKPPSVTLHANPGVSNIGLLPVRVSRAEVIIPHRLSLVAQPQYLHRMLGLVYKSHSCGNSAMKRLPGLSLVIRLVSHDIIQRNLRPTVA